MKNNLKKSDKAKLIYNPTAGKKRSMVSIKEAVSLEDIKELLVKYQIPADFYPTKHPGHATILSQKAAKEGYKLVIAAGGDGTVAEVASGLVGKEISLGILPLGSYMNIARMLYIPTEIEKAVMLLKIGRERRIDAGLITSLGGEKLDQPLYFFEEAGIGIEAQIHYYLTGIFERQEYQNILKIFKTVSDFYQHRVTVKLDGKRLENRVILLTVSNGPYSWAAAKLSPTSRLNDHRLTVRMYKMTRLELTGYLLRLIFKGQAPTRDKVEKYTVRKVKLTTPSGRLFHADARIFSQTPVEMEIVPNALSVITGFPPPDAPKTLNERTFLD